MFCGQCGAPIPEDAPYCRTCGAPKAERERAPAQTPQTEAYPLLAAANLARIRRQYQDAASKCLEVLRRHPKDATAHSLLGDIYREQGLLRDAIEWYRQALDLDPTSAADREKFDQLTDQVYAADAGRTAAAPSRSRLRRLADRVCGVLRCADLPRPLRLAMAATVVLLVLVLLFILAHRASMAPPAGAQGGGAPAATAPPSASVPPADSEPAVVTPGPAPPADAPPEEPAEPDLTTPAGADSPGLAARQSRLLGALRSASITGERPRAIDAVWIDPRTQAVMIDFRAPELATPTDTKRNLILVALALAGAAHRADRGVASATLRGALPVPDASGDRAMEYVFVGEISVHRLPGPTASRLPPDQALRLFTNVWWHSLYADLVP